ncbi:hypothetical protein MPL3356_250003 [Mesorhizobium plurifarium]|uniref:Uncharacterized protein n=1 Tax=Mesorhizobium plurifarium TaxID=69974 RepID=A0A090FZC9_MESPL|nr:hypothetical protein MPLB_1680077 [Mesorhizobium sp. ORS 3324]CDX17855.1 hypothetical protein MPL3356_250003 [Mesorhizobium plurifarium]CDX43500.1 hypothetical protein MPLA_670092 [Mesorhizobium sp. ORS 3359]CDX53096.1 hypothetical protein MPL3365_170253 [Mesorhizobium plurifarium]
MKVRVRHIGPATHPSEVVVSVDTTTGAEHLVVNQRSLKDNKLEIGYPINSLDSNLLVELPRETINGSWRVWVPQASVE